MIEKIKPTDSISKWIDRINNELELQKVVMRNDTIRRLQ